MSDDDPRPLDLDHLLAKAKDCPEPWATDLRDLVALVRQLSTELVSAENELYGLRAPGEVLPSSLAPPPAHLLAAARGAVHSGPARLAG